MKKITNYCLIFFIPIGVLSGCVMLPFYIPLCFKVVISQSLCYLFVPERSCVERIAKVYREYVKESIAMI